MSQSMRESGWSRVGRIALSMAMAAAVWCPPSIALGELPVALSEFPRRVRRQLPTLTPSRQLRVGPLDLHPFFETAVEFDDNIRLEEDDKDSDVIFTQRPGLIGELHFGDHRLEAGYGAEVLTFANEREEDTTNHLAHAIMDLNFNDLSFTLSDTMEDSTGRVFSENSTRDHVFLNTAQVLGRFDRPNWAFETAWTHNTVDHKTPTRNNSDYGEDVVSVLGGVKLGGRTLILVEPTIGLLNFDHNVDNADQTYWQLMGGLRGELTSKLTALVKLGFQDRQMSDVGGQGEIKDFENLVADVTLTFKPTTTDTINLFYVRRPVPSSFANNSWYRQDRVSLVYRKRLLRKWTLQPSIAWQMAEYPQSGTVAGVTKERRDHFISSGVGLRYDIQEWLSTGVAYNFRSRNSNLPTLDYDNNRISFDVTVAF
jgi:hypothetical protein